MEQDSLHKIITIEIEYSKLVKSWAEAPLCDIQRPDFSGKVVQPTEQIAVNLTKPGHGSDLYAVDVPRFE